MEITRMALSPMESWMLIGMLFLLAGCITLLIKALITAIEIAPENVRLAGFAKGIWYALGGVRLINVTMEKCIEVVYRNDGGYIATTYDGEQNDEYLVIPLKEDTGNADYDVVKALDISDEKLLDELLPESRVRNYYELSDEKTGEVISKIYFIYLKHDDAKEVAETLDKFFEERYNKQMEYYEAIA